MKHFFSESGGALLFTIITAFVLSMIGATLVLFTSNQYRLINNDIERKKALYWLKAGKEYADYKLRTGLVVQNNTPYTLAFPDNTNITITIRKPDPDNLSEHKIEVTTTY
jgi:hypothetical protein